MPLPSLSFEPIPESSNEKLTICVLNLKRKSDRRALFQQLNPYQDLRFAWVEATDGRTLERKTLIQKNILTSHQQHFTAGSLGCAISHRLMWLHCVDVNLPLLVCEDDAILRRDFRKSFVALYQKLPSDWDILLLGYNFNSILDVELIPGLDLQSHFSPATLSAKVVRDFIADTTDSNPFPLNNAFGTCSYAISPKGAAQLVELCFPMAGIAVGIPALKRTIKPAIGIDTIANAHYGRLQAFCALPPLAITPNDPQDSETLPRKQ